MQLNITDNYGQLNIETSETLTYKSDPRYITMSNGTVNYNTFNIYLILKPQSVVSRTRYRIWDGGSMKLLVTNDRIHHLFIFFLIHSI